MMLPDATLDEAEALLAACRSKAIMFATGIPAITERRAFPGDRAAAVRRAFKTIRAVL
jgi:hypothetical protein